MRALLRDLLTYRLMAQNWRRAHPSLPVGFWNRWRFFAAWRASLREGRTPLADGRPWITFGAWEFLSAPGRRWGRVFEWGMGGSSLFFAGRADEVVSVEHDPEWFDEVRREIERRQISHWRGLLREPEPAALPRSSPPDPANWDPPVSDDARYAGRTFHRYAGAIDEFPDGHFDLIVVDGRARPACLAHARGKLAAGGLLVVDNAERPYYGRALGLWREAGWQCRSYSGPGPYVGQFWTTQIWSRPPSGQ